MNVIPVTIPNQISARHFHLTDVLLVRYQPTCPEIKMFTVTYTKRL